MTDERNGISGADRGGGRHSTSTGSAVLGEVVEASTARFVAQCPPDKLHAPPALGAFVKIAPPGANVAAARALPEPEQEDPFADPPLPSCNSLAARSLSPPALMPLSYLTDLPDAREGTLYALVASATTGSAEPGRRPAAYGLDEATLRREQPQIFDLLATEFVALPVGTAENGAAQARSACAPSAPACAGHPVPPRKSWRLRKAPTSRDGCFTRPVKSRPMNCWSPACAMPAAAATTTSPTWCASASS